MTQNKTSAQAMADDVLRERLVNEVTGHMPASGECNEYLIRASVHWAYDRIIRPALEAEARR